jgi:hypothetical protein
MNSFRRQEHNGPFPADRLWSITLIGLASFDEELGLLSYLVRTLTPMRRRCPPQPGRDITANRVASERDTGSARPLPIMPTVARKVSHNRHEAAGRRMPVLAGRFRFRKRRPRAADCSPGSCGPAICAALRLAPRSGWGATLASSGLNPEPCHLTYSTDGRSRRKGCRVPELYTGPSRPVVIKWPGTLTARRRASSVDRSVR